jgi:hypothetical protein
VAIYRRATRRAALTYPKPSGRVAVLLALPLLGGLTIGSALAELDSGVAQLSAAQAEESGTAISILRRQDLAPGLTEVRVPSWTGMAGGAGAGRLLALAPGARMAAVASQVGPAQASLILARDDGSQLQVSMPGLISAGFAADGRWLAAIDGTGALWRIDAGSGLATRLADGPFLGNPLIGQSGDILVLRVPSVDAPFTSRLARVAADGSTAILPGDDELVYGAQPLADGSLAVTLHQGPGTLVVRQRIDGRRTLLVNLGQDAVNVAITADGAAVAWERYGEVFLQKLPSGQPQLLGTGSHPRFAPDGRTVLIDQPDRTVLRDLNGTAIASFTAQAAFDDCAEECGQ